MVLPEQMMSSYQIRKAYSKIAQSKILKKNDLNTIMSSGEAWIDSEILTPHVSHTQII